MTRIFQLLKAIFVTTVVFVVLAVIAGNFPKIGVIAALSSFAVALYARFKPITSLWLENKPTTIAIMAVSVVIIFASARKVIEVWHEEERLVKEETERKLQSLRSTDPTAYLAALKSANDDRWEPELYKLNRPEFDALIADRRAKEEQNRKQEIEKLLAELNTSKPDIDASHRIYYRLAFLDPANKDYKNKLENVSKQIEARNTAKAQNDNPETFVLLEDFTWSKGGFGNVMMANFAIKNRLPRPVKDVQIRCTHRAPSGTEIDQNTRTIYERFEPNSSKRIKEFNMGFIHTQAARSECQIIGVVVLK